MVVASLSTLIWSRPTSALKTILSSVLNVQINYKAVANCVINGWALTSKETTEYP
jgi:hypothetical protein